MVTDAVCKPRGRDPGSDPLWRFFHFPPKFLLNFDISGAPSQIRGWVCIVATKFDIARWSLQFAAQWLSQFIEEAATDHSAASFRTSGPVRFSSLQFKAPTGDPRQPTIRTPTTRFLSSLLGTPSPWALSFSLPLLALAFPYSMFALSMRCKGQG